MIDWIDNSRVSGVLIVVAFFYLVVVVKVEEEEEEGGRGGVACWIVNVSSFTSPSTF